MMISQHLDFQISFQDWCQTYMEYLTILIQKGYASKLCFGDRNSSLLPTGEVAPVQAIKANRTNEGTAPLILNRGNRWK